MERRKVDLIHKCKGKVRCQGYCRDKLAFLALTPLHRCWGTDKQQITQEFSGLEKPGDLMNSVLNRWHSLSGREAGSLHVSLAAIHGV